MEVNDLINQTSNKLSVINHINTVYNVTNNRRQKNKKIMDLYDNCTQNSVNRSMKDHFTTCKKYTKEDDYMLLKQ